MNDPRQPLAVERLRQLAEHLVAATELPVDIRVELGTSLLAFLAAGGSLELDEALGLRPGPGRSPWWRREQLAKRDAALRDLARRHFANQTRLKAARAIAEAAAHYEAVVWPRDSRARQMPEAYVGTPRETFFALLSGGQRIPKYRQLFVILSEARRAE